MSKKIRQWMEFDTAEDATQLAENAAHEFGHDEWLDDPDHQVWEIAIGFFDDGGFRL